MVRSLLLTFALLLAGCGGGTVFAPSTSPFLGGFTAADAQIGDLSFTANPTGIGGTGMIRDGALEVPVAISGNVSGQTINGLVSNTHLGTGTFRGSFSNTAQASGTFTFALVTGTNLTGTWTASAQ